MAAKRQLLAQRRKAVGFSQEALASVLEVERSTVVRWESGDTEPLPWIRPNLARALGITVDQLGELLGRAGPAVPRQPQADPEIEPGPGLVAPQEPVPWRDVPAQSSLLAAGRGGEALPVCQLPPTVADFTGREPQIAQLTGMLSHDGDRLGVPIAVIAGLPGAGKTALALHVAHKLRAAFPDGQLWVPLEGATGHPRAPGEVLGELIRVLGVPGSAIPKSTAQRAALYRSLLAGRRVLVVADDAASAAQVQPLLPGTGQCAVLVTSRSELAGPPGSRLFPLEPLTRSEAVQLLARIVGEQRVAAEPGAAARAGRRLRPAAAGGPDRRSPAGRAHVLAAVGPGPQDHPCPTPGRARNRRPVGAGQPQPELPGARRARPHRVPPPGPAGHRRVRRMAGRRPARQSPDAADVVNQLADSSLLTATGIDPAGQPRYRPHDLLRDYAAERLADEPQAQRHAALGRVTDGWLQLAALADARLPREPYFPPPAPALSAAVATDSLLRNITTDPMAWFTAERLGLLAVLERCCADGDHQAAAQLASFMASFQHLQGRLDDAERMWRAIAAAAQQAGDPGAAARARLRLAAAACGQGRHAEASPMVDQCAASFDELADQRALATALYWRSVCESNLGSYAAPGNRPHRAMHLAQDTDDPRTEALAQRLLALAQAKLPDGRKDAVTSAERALMLARELGEPAFEHEILHTVAHVYILSGRHEDALGLCQDGLGMAGDLGVQVAAADWLGLTGDAYYGQGRYRESAESLRSALPIYRDHFMHRHHGLCLLKMGYAYQALGDNQTAIRCLRESLAILEPLQLEHYADRARETLVSCLHSRARWLGPAVSAVGVCRR